MRYVGRVYRPPSEADAFILQATVGCSWNKCTYCDMYREKRFRIRPWEEIELDIELARDAGGDRIEKVFVADGDALVMDEPLWHRILERCRACFPALRRVSSYAMATNVLEKRPDELRRLSDAGLSLLYIGPESGDAVTLQRIAKGSTFEDHVNAADQAHAAGLALSVIFLLGAGGVERTEAHAEASAALASAMDPEFLAALTLTVIPGTPLARRQEKGMFELPDVRGLLRELQTIVSRSDPTDALFRTNHASNYLPLGGRLPRDRSKILEVIERALRGEVPLRPEGFRGL